MANVRMNDILREMLDNARFSDNWVGSIAGITVEAAANIGEDPGLMVLAEKLPIVTKWAEHVAQIVASDFQIATKQLKISPDMDMAFHVVFLVERDDYVLPGLVHAKYAVDAMVNQIAGAEVRYRFEVFDQSAHAGYSDAHAHASASGALQQVVISKDL